MTPLAGLADAVLAAANELRRDGPVPVVFANHAFVPLLDNWLAHARRAGVRRALVIALDDATAAHPVPDGCITVAAPLHGTLSDLWLFRLQIFALLTARGIDFVHADVDAVWLADPRSACFADPVLDLVFSQGTYRPEPAFAAWGFVLCCGYFAVRASPGTAQFFHAVQARAAIEQDDQAAVNLLLAEGGMRWQSTGDDAYQTPFAGRSFTCHRSMAISIGAPFGLRIGLLPYHLAPRLPTAEAGALLKHPSSPRDVAGKIRVLQDCGCWMVGAAKRPQMLVFSYHKSGTTLFDRVMRSLAEPFGLRVHVQYGMAYAIDPAPDVVLLPHALLGFQLARPLRGVRIIRDPRDIWVSAYLYHCRTNEAWCVNTDFDPRPPITYPRVDFSMQQRPERWKRGWLARLNGRSYQQNLRERDQAAGLAFELDGYTGCTLAAMRDWRTLPNVLDVKLEDIARDYDATMGSVFRHLGFTPAECEGAVRLAAAEDINRMDGTALAANPHIHSRTLSKWRTVLSQAQVRAFEQRYGDLLLSLGYELSG